MGIKTHDHHQREMKRVYLKYAYKTIHGQIIEFDRELTIGEVTRSDYFRLVFPDIKRAPEHDTYVDIEECDELCKDRITGEKNLTRDEIVVEGVYINKKDSTAAFRVKEITKLELLIEVLQISYIEGRILSVTITHKQRVQYSDIKLSHFVKVDDPAKTTKRFNRKPISKLSKEFKTTSGDDMLALGEG